MIELRVMQLNSGDKWVERTYQDMNALRDDLTQTASDEYQSRVLNNLPVNGSVTLGNGPNYLDTYILIETDNAVEGALLPDEKDTGPRFTM